MQRTDIELNMKVAEMNFDGLREDKVLPPGGVPMWYVKDRAVPQATKQGAKGARPYRYTIPGRGVMTYNKYTWTMPDTITLPGGTRKEIAYTPLMQPKTISVKDPAQNPLMTYDYSYSPAGNITTKNTGSGNYTYQYDPLYRLTNAANLGNTETYTYDPVGNRLTSADVSGNWNYNNNNELSSYNSVSYEYDLNGNTTKKTVGSQITTYTYNIDNRLVQLQTPNSQLITYTYDPFGRRLWKEVGGSRRHFLYTDEGLVGEYDSAGIEIKTYGYAPNSTWSTNPLFQKIGNVYYWYQNDHLGTPQKITDSSGAVVWATIYDAFGKATVTVNAIENNLRFPGQYFDAETGYHYNGHRYYEPRTGRYITADPIGLKGRDVNFYSYTRNNPANNMDYNGLRVECTNKLISLAVSVWFLSGEVSKGILTCKDGCGKKTCYEYITACGGGGLGLQNIGMPPVTGALSGEYGGWGGKSAGDFGGWSFQVGGAIAAGPKGVSGSASVSFGAQGIGGGGATAGPAVGIAAGGSAMFCYTWIQSEVPCVVPF